MLWEQEQKKLYCLHFCSKNCKIQATKAPHFEWAPLDGGVPSNHSKFQSHFTLRTSTFTQHQKTYVTNWLKLLLQFQNSVGLQVNSIFFFTINCESTLVENKRINNSISLPRIQFSSSNWSDYDFDKKINYANNLLTLTISNRKVSPWYENIDIDLKWHENNV